MLPSTALVELIARPSVIYLALGVRLRVVGQRELGGLGLTDILVFVLVAEARSCCATVAGPISTSTIG